MTGCTNSTSRLRLRLHSKLHFWNITDSAKVSVRKRSGLKRAFATRELCEPRTSLCHFCSCPLYLWHCVANAVLDTAEHEQPACTHPLANNATLAARGDIQQTPCVKSRCSRCFLNRVSTALRHPRVLSSHLPFVNVCTRSQGAV